MATFEQFLNAHRQDKLHAELGYNPCRRITFEDEAGTLHHTQCNNPRCPDCGKRKAHLLWNGIQDTFTDGDHLIMTTNEHDYRRLRDRIRQHRRRHNQQYEYVSWHIGADRRLTLTNAPLTDTPVTTLHDIKDSLLNAYQKGLAALRKSWGIVSVTLSAIAFDKSVTGKLKFRRTNLVEDIDWPTLKGIIEDESVLKLLEWTKIRREEEKQSRRRVFQRRYGATANLPDPY